MSKIAIVTDSVVSIPESILNSLEIYWVPYYIHRGQEVLRDLVTIQREAFYQWLPTAKVLPTTASPGPGDYLDLYETCKDLPESQTRLQQILADPATLKKSPEEVEKSCGVMNP